MVNPGDGTLARDVTFHTDSLATSNTTVENSCAPEGNYYSL